MPNQTMASFLSFPNVTSHAQRQDPLTTTAAAATPQRAPLPTFAVEAEGSPCRLVVRGVLLPGRATLRHAPFGRCRCLESDDGAVRYWMNWMGRVCAAEGLITPAQAHALFLAYSAPDARSWWMPPLAGEEEAQALRQAGAALVLGLDLFREVQRRLGQPQWGLKISRVEVVDTREEELSEMFEANMEIEDEEDEEEEVSDDEPVHKF